jgi:thiamine-monophosphate kinase
MRGEFELIDLLRERIASAGAGDFKRLFVGSGDDAAVTTPGGATATSVDAIVEGVHFSRRTFPARAIGVKALAAALSDLAAMGASPGEAYVQLGLPDDVSEDELVAIANGLGECAAAAGVAIAGGDISASPVLFLCITAVGHADDASSLVTRAGAKPGDALVVTGALGAAAAGLLLLERHDLAAGLGAGVADALRARQLEPEPRLAAGTALAATGASAMIDLSDGLAGDARHVAASSGARLRIEADAVPVSEGVHEVARAAGEDPERVALAGGEDYELLAALPAAKLDAALAALRKLGLAPAVIGGVEAGEGLVLCGANGRELNVRGYDQVRSRVPAEPT